MMPESNDRPPIVDAPLSAVLLAHEGTIHRADVVRAWADFLGTMNRPCELIVVHRADIATETDRAENCATISPSARFIGQDTPGIGAGLRTGLAAASYPLFFYTDCTNEYAPQDLRKLLEVIDHVDLVSGFRERPDGGGAEPRNDWLYRFILRLIFGLRLKDVDCSFKLFRRSVFARIPIQSSGEFVHAEVMAKANFLGCLIGEVGVRYAPQTEARLDTGARQQRRREALRVFRQPDFGPAELPATS